MLVFYTVDHAVKIPGQSCKGIVVQILGAGQDETAYLGFSMEGEASLLSFPFGVALRRGYSTL